MSVNCARLPDSARAVTQDASFVMEKRGAGFAYDDIAVRAEGANGELVYLSAGRSELRFVALRWNGEWDKGTRFLGDTMERAYGNLAWRGLETDNVMGWYFITACGARCAGYGVKTQPDALCFWTVDDGGATLWLDVRSGADGVLLCGREILAAELVCGASESLSPYRFLQGFCRSMCGAPLLPPAPVYGGNNWCYAYGDSSAEAIIKDAALIAELSQGLDNRPYMVVDDGWQELARTSYGSAQGRPYERGNALFPDMAGLAAQIKRMGVRPGLWMRPLRTGEKYIDKGLLLERQPGFLDPSLPQTLALIAQDVERMTGWGYELIKYDFVVRDVTGGYFNTRAGTLGARGWHFKNRDRTNAEIMKDISRTIYAHARGAVLIGCNVSGHLSAGMIHLHRSGDDTSGRSYARSVQMGVNALAFRLAQNNAFFSVDADCICVTKAIPWEKNKELLRLYAQSGTALFASVAPDAFSGEVKAALRGAFALASRQKQDMEPLDWLDSALPRCYNVDGNVQRFLWAPENGYDLPLMS